MKTETATYYNRRVCHNEGWNAFHNSAFKSANPYPKFSAGYDYWLEGWNLAYSDMCKQFEEAQPCHTQQPATTKATGR